MNEIEIVKCILAVFLLAIMPYIPMPISLRKGGKKRRESNRRRPFEKRNVE